MNGDMCINCIMKTLNDWKWYMIDDMSFSKQYKFNWLSLKDPLEYVKAWNNGETKMCVVCYLNCDGGNLVM